MKKILNFLNKYIFVLIIVLTITLRVTNAFRINVVNGSSMFPTLTEGQILLGSSIGTLDRNDIVVAKFNDNLVIKRLVGLPGETIEYKENKLYINGELIDEPYIYDKESNLYGDWKFELGEDQYLILGDNRNVSYDGRMYGPVSKEEIKQIIFFGVSE